MKFVEAVNNFANLQSLWDSPTTFGKSVRPKKLYEFCRLEVRIYVCESFSLFNFHSFKYFNW